MAIVNIPDQNRVLRDREEIAAYLSPLGITYERWDTSRNVAADAPADAILAAYAEEIEALKAREDDGGFIKLVRRVGFSPGEKVRIVDGAFTDNLALVEGVSDRERIAVLLDLLGRKVRVVLGADLIAAA